MHSETLNWLKNTVSTFHNLRLTVINFARHLEPIKESWTDDPQPGSLCYCCYELIPLKIIDADTNIIALLKTQLKDLTVHFFFMEAT